MKQDPLTDLCEECEWICQEYRKPTTMHEEIDAYRKIYIRSGLPLWDSGGTVCTYVTSAFLWCHIYFLFIYGAYNH